MPTKDSDSLIIGGAALLALTAASSGSDDPPEDNPPSDDPPEQDQVVANASYETSPGELYVDATDSTGPIAKYAWELRRINAEGSHEATGRTHTFEGIPGGTYELTLTVLASNPENYDTVSGEIEMPSVPVRPPLPTPDPQSDYFVFEGGGTPMVEISVFSSVALTNSNGRATEHIIANTLADAFGSRGFGYRVKMGLPNISVPNQQPGCCSVSSSNTCKAGESDALYHWRDVFSDVNDRHKSKDSNLLLLDGPEADTDYLGCAGVGGTMATARADAVTQVRERKIRAPRSDLQHRLEHTALHEVAHNLGVSHDDHMHNTTVDHDRDWWIRTPCGSSGATDATQAFCGYSLIPYESQWTYAFANRYSNCAVGHFEQTIE